MSQDSTKIQLNGIYIHYVENIGLRFVSTDLYRIACTTIKTDDIINNLQPLIISRRTISELIYLLDNIKESSTLHIKLSKNQITFEATIKNSIKSVINSRLVGGNFPEYHSALK